MRTLRFVLAALVLSFAPTDAAVAQTIDPGAAALSKLFAGTTVDAASFSEAFTKQVPVAALQSTVDGYRMRLGPLGTATKAGNDYALIFAHGKLLATLSLDSTGRIASLLFHDEISDANRAALERFFAAKAPAAEWFTPDFLAQVPISQITALSARLADQEGAFAHIDERDGAYYAIFEKAENHVVVSTGADGRFTYLRIFGPIARTSNLQDALSKLRRATGSLTYLILRGQVEIAALSADRPLAVGSTFKLAVLAALRAQIETHERSWSDVVRLEASAKSLPSGTFQTWPDGLPITLATYAAQMISQSDNTAADVLANVVGRAALEALSPRNTPFLTTRELFTLKAQRTAIRDAYHAGDATARRALLAKLDTQSVPAPERVALSPDDIERSLEWYMSNRELCALMQRVADLDLMTINPGFTSGWRRTAYKGGSDAGAINFTSYVSDTAGTSYCVSVTWNDAAQPLDEGSLSAAYGAVLEQLARGRPRAG